MSPTSRACCGNEDMATERIGADDLLHLGCQAVEAGAQINRLASEKDLRSWRQAIIRTPAALTELAAAPSR
jgi:hypothetical protein